MTCLLATVLISTLSSFSSAVPNNHTSIHLKKATSFSFTYLYKRVIVSGIAYNVYVAYDPVANAMLLPDTKVFLDDCTECIVYDMGNVTCTNLGGLSWQVSSPGMAVSTECEVNIPFDGIVAQQDPYCD